MQFDHMVSDGLVNFYLYKIFLKEKRKVEDCIKGGHDIVNKLYFLEVIDSELHNFRQNP
jgi:hypothetical protein